jgi:hypothetical protein
MATSWSCSAVRVTIAAACASPIAPWPCKRAWTESSSMRVGRAMAIRAGMAARSRRTRARAQAIRRSRGGADGLSGGARRLPGFGMARVTVDHGRGRREGPRLRMLGAGEPLRGSLGCTLMEGDDTYELLAVPEGATPDQIPRA